MCGAAVHTALILPSQDHLCPRTAVFLADIKEPSHFSRSRTVSKDRNQRIKLGRDTDFTPSTVNQRLGENQVLWTRMFIWLLYRNKLYHSVASSKPRYEPQKLLFGCSLTLVHLFLLLHTKQLQTWQRITCAWMVYLLTLPQEYDWIYPAL